MFVDALQYAYALIVVDHALVAFGATPLELGLLGFTTNCVYAGSSFAISRLSDTMGSLRLIALGLVLLIVLALPLVALAGGVPVLCLANGVVGLAMGCFWAPLERQLSLLSPGKQLWRSLGVFNLAWAAGVGLGSVAGPGAYAGYGLGRSLWLCAGLALVALVAVFSRLPRPAEEGGNGVERGASSGSSSRRGPAEDRAAAFVTVGRLANFTSYFAIGGLTYFFMFYANSHGIRSEIAGWLYFSRDLARFGTFFWLQVSSRWHYSMHFLGALQFAAGLSLIVSGLSADLWVLAAAFAVFGVFAGLSYYSSIFYGLNLRHREGKHSGLHEAILAFAGSVSPLCCGVVGQMFVGSPSVILLFLGAVVLGGLVLEIAVLRRAERC